MASSLQLRLERAIGANRLSSALELPLDRKLGSLDRLTYVYANALPLRMERRISEQPVPNALYMALSQPLGTLSPPTYVTSNALPLPLTEQISEQPVASELPLGMTRKLGTIFGAPVIVPPVDPTDPTDPIDPPEYAPPMTDLASYIGVMSTQTRNISKCTAVSRSSRNIANDIAIRRTTVVNVAQCYAVRVRNFIHMSNCSSILTSLLYELSTCNRSTYIPFVLLFNEVSPVISSTIGYTRCIKVHSNKVVQYQQCSTLPLQSAVNYAASAGHKLNSISVERCQSVKTQHAVQVPDRYYPIPEPPPDEVGSVCGIRPPSSQLPLRMTRQRRGLLSSELPLTMVCWHDVLGFIVPSLRTYIMHNTITANIGGIAIDPLSFSAQADMDGYCWQGNITITAKDYAKVKSKLDAPRGSEPMINVTVNGELLSFIAEEQQRSRQFAQHAYSLSGRSITARLGADYAQSQGGLIGQASYASQIAAQQLNGLSISVQDWSINDWLVPADAYSVTGKTPMAVLLDIAQACGGFVVSDPSAATVSLKPRWPVAAWELATATPDVTIPASVIRQVSDQKRVNPLYNTVSLSSESEGGTVYRQAQARDANAPSQAHALYTDRDVIVPAGTAILSDSGTHGDYTISLRWMEKYSLPLAQMGQVWQVNDPEGAWRGVVTGVGIDTNLDNDAPTVWQTVSIDRYLDV